ncbi:MAG: glycoside hydrolase family 43 protein [Mariniphaga sp.]|nr:glycoside hydrolase family 43 protein [Mariniphaga sp.]
MKPVFLNILITALGLFIAFNGLSQISQQTSHPTGITIVPALEKPLEAVMPEEKDMAGYLLVYFKDQTQSAYMAISHDGYTFTDLNDGDFIFDGTQLAEQKGVRDPHIARGPDGAFYLAMTDLHIFGQRAGHRTTRWQRPEEQYGWGNNRAIVLMKSYDLIHWTHSDFRVDLAFPELGDIDCSWAPQTVYDPLKQKMMVYFTIRYNNKEANMYCSYTDDAFTRLETMPERIPDIGGIDGDITKAGDKYHLFYVAGAKILHAVSDEISRDYKSETRRIDPETAPTEAPNVFKRLGTNTYVLMYDVYGGRPNNMGFSETTDFVIYKDIGHFNEGIMKTTNFERPKHGAVIHLTMNELKTVAEHWEVDINLE